MKNPTFSIITSIYNQKGYLPKITEALEKQTFKDFEWIICDDGSSDGTKEFFDKQIPEVEYSYLWQEDKGMRLTKVINKAIKQAKGEYCVFIMGDSFPELNYLEVLNQFVKPNRILCGTRIHIDNGKGVDVDWRIKKEVIPKENVLLIDEPYNIITGNGLCIPTEAFRKYGGWDEKLSGYGGDDNEIAARLYFKGYLIWSIVDARLYHYWHKNQENNPKNKSIVNKLLKKYGS